MSTDPRFAEPTPFARLMYAQAAGACGDACILVSMAGSIFFSSPTSAARGKVLLFLLITMTPFVIIAPILGPALDRMKGGRRLFLILSAAGRALLCLALAMYISKPAPEGLLVYPLAFGVLSYIVVKTLELKLRTYFKATWGIIGCCVAGGLAGLGVSLAIPTASPGVRMVIVGSTAIAVMLALLATWQNITPSTIAKSLKG